MRFFWQIKAVSWWHPVTSCLTIWQTFLWTSLVLQCVCWLTLVTNPTSFHWCLYQSPAPYLCEATGSEHGLQVEKKGAVHWRAHMHIVMHKATCVDIRRYIQQVHCHRYECIWHYDIISYIYIQYKLYCKSNIHTRVSLVGIWFRTSGSQFIGHTTYIGYRSPDPLAPWVHTMGCEEAKKSPVTLNLVVDPLQEKRTSPRILGETGWVQFMKWLTADFESFKSKTFTSFCILFAHCCSHLNGLVWIRLFGNTLLVESSY